MKSREGSTVLFVALAAAFVVAFVVTAGQAAGHALWPVVLLGALSFAAFTHYLWHRRAVARLLELHLTQQGRWHNVQKFHPWPKMCGACGYKADRIVELNTHDSLTSACMRVTLALEGPPELTGYDATDGKYQATVMSGDTGGVDTMTPGGRGREELEGRPRGELEP
jgi:hypothetical protein